MWLILLILLFPSCAKTEFVISKELNELIEENTKEPPIIIFILPEKQGIDINENIQPFVEAKNG